LEPAHFALADAVVERLLAAGEIDHRPAPGTLKARRCAGGDINQAMTIDLGDRRVFVKFHSDAPPGMFEAEGEGLKEISADGSLRVPRPLVSGRSGDTDFLALEFLHLTRGSDAAAAALGRGLARLHRTVRPFFGWHRDNTIGRTPQANARSERWTDFYARHRLVAQGRLLTRTTGDRAIEDACLDLGHRLDDFFDGYDPHPALLHGDLWGGNWSSLADGTPVLFDPACYYGDRETDLAMTELFGGFGASFRNAYEAELPVDSGYRRRRDLYQLYHVLNHANLFGGGYVEQSRHLLHRLLADTA